MKPEPCRERKPPRLSRWRELFLSEAEGTVAIFGQRRSWDDIGGIPTLRTSPKKLKRPAATRIIISP
jgi:hypothetical protein